MLIDTLLVLAILVLLLALPALWVAMECTKPFRRNPC